MSRDKQIEEMAKTVCHLDRTCDECMTSFECKAMMYAKRFYNAGYRKASEVAREIFAEIEEIRLRQIRKSDFFRNGSTEEMERKFYEGAEWGLRQLSHWFAELKKKYTEDGK